MISLPLNSQINVLRKKIVCEGISLKEGMTLIDQLTAKQQYLDALDVYEQLYRQYPKEATQILAMAYDTIYLFLREKKSRYWMYQARYFDFQIQPRDRVLDIGSGHMPFPFATHLADYAIEDANYGRAGAEFKKVEGKPVYACSVENMPFANKEFDFVYCSHVLEHAENPERACRELMRIAKRGYIETPTKGKDIFFDSARVSNHRWFVDVFDRRLVFTEYCPEEIKGLECDVLGRMVYDPKTEYEKAFYALHFLKADLLNAMSYWEDDFEYEVRRLSGLSGGTRSKQTIVQKQSDPKREETSPDPTFSFVMIVLNGMPFIKSSLQSIYEFAHQIIVVEGAVEQCRFAAGPDGSSTDGTVEFLHSFPDPDNKMILIQGAWTEKCQMQNEALKYVTGDYVWLIDSDEVYKQEDLESVRQILRQDPSITQVNFIPDNFWKGLDTIFVSDKFFESDYHYRRLFRYVPGAVFTSHRPPTMQWPGRQETTEQMHLLDGKTTRKMGIVPFHYSYVTDAQVRQKVELYRRYGWGKGWEIDLHQWYEQCFKKWTPSNSREIESRWPVWAGDKNSRTQQFTGTHPEVMRGFKFEDPVVKKPASSFSPYPEEESLPVIGSPKIQRRILDAWQKIETDAPVRKRMECLRKHIEQDRPFWNLHGALAYTADRLRPRSYLEIGVRTGCSMVQVLANSNPQLVVGVDLWTGHYADLPNTLEFAKAQIETFQQKTGNYFPVRLIQGNSHTILKDLIQKNCKFDLITVDGDHSEQGAWEDLVDAQALLAEQGAIVFDDIIHPSFPFLMEVAQRFLKTYPDFKAVVNSSQDNGCVIFLKGIKPAEFLRPAGLDGSSCKPLKVAEEYVKAGMNIDKGSAFSDAIRSIFQQTRPRKIIETGTYLGQGTTTIIAEAMRRFGIEGTFFTIEVNPEYYAKAKRHIQGRGYQVTALHGLSVPRSFLPTEQEIRKATVEAVEFEDLFVDHPEAVRAERYFRETNFQNVPDNLLLLCLREFENRPDFVLLDSAGHMGFIEFQYLVQHLEGPCIIALDDIYHIKHHKSFCLMQNDPRFEILVSSKEKFGFCIARFAPQHQERLLPEPKHILWLRPDAIGDAVLSSSMLPAIRRKFPSARITVFAKDAAAPLYEYCPYVDRILRCSEQEMWHDPQFVQKRAYQIRSLKIDCILYSVYSRDTVMDLLVHASGAAERIGIDGDFCNTTPEYRVQSDAWYTRLIKSPGRWKPELQRHADFLKGLGCPDESVKPLLWLSPEDEAFARQWFEQNKISADQTVVLFAGARTFHRLYDGYGQALRSFAKRNKLTVLALGGENDFETNQRNLDCVAAEGVQTINLSGKLSLRQSAAMIKRCCLAVGAETGLAHIAAALEVPHVILIGGGHFGRFVPYSPFTTLAALPLDCYGCDWHCRYEEEKIYCIRGIQPFVLAEAIEQTYQKTARKPRIFVQDSSCYNRPDQGPAWKLFDAWVDMNGVELHTVSDPRTSCRAIERDSETQGKTRGHSVLDNPDEFTYSRKSHFSLLQNAALALYGRPVDPAQCDLKRYQDLLVFEFIKRHMPKGSRILDIGGGDSRILNYFYRDYECWNIDPLRGEGNGLQQLDPRGRYKLVRDYIGNFNPELPDHYFDFVFSISALEHVPQDDPALFEKIRDDIDRVLKPNGYSLHCFDVVLKDRSFWTNPLLPFLFETRRTRNGWVSPEILRSDTDLYVMTESAYNQGWRKITKQSYETFGKPLSYQVLWQQAPVPGIPEAPSVQLPVSSGRNSGKRAMPKITVVTPSMNQGKYLEACIQSVLSQQYPNLEYIIMDGGSTDGSVEIIKKYEPYLAYWQSRSDGGQYRAVEEGFRRSTGDIMTWLNSDDMFFPDAFEIAAAVFTECCDIDWMTGRVVNFNDDGSLRLIVEKIPLWCRRKYLNKDYRDPYLQQEGTFWRRSLWEKAGARMRTELLLAGDLELWTRFFRYADLHTLDAVLAGYRLQPNRKIATLLDQYHQEADRILEEELTRYLKEPNHPVLAPPPPPVSSIQICRYRKVFRDTHLDPMGSNSVRCRTPVREAGRPEKYPILLATSLAPGNMENQQKAVQSWLQAGFQVLSINSPDEIGRLRRYFPQVSFVPVGRDGSEYFGKPLIYIDDILAVLKETQAEEVGIINSDIHLRMNRGYIEKIRQCMQDSVICLNRMNTEDLDSNSSQLFINGFDAFFFNQKTFNQIPSSRFCLGTAWWDYYFPIVCILHQISLVRFQDPIAFHIKHPLNWNKKQWICNAKYFFEQMQELCKNRVGYNQFSGLGHKFKEALDCYNKVILKGYPENLIKQSYAYAEFILGIILGNIRIMDAPSAPVVSRRIIEEQKAPSRPGRSIVTAGCL